MQGLGAGCCPHTITVLERSVVVQPLAPVIEPEVDEGVGLDETWKVVVWNDPVNLFDYVIWVLRTLFGYSEDKAYQLTHQVHHEGRAIVADGPREQAEMDCYRLHQHGLWATLEQ
jgi:ATP-dependent Clp protease adaptor protein ClpS